jgi:polysaccharide biosynthesis protein PslH
MTGPSVLYLTCHLPLPPHSGGRLRDAEMVRRLGARVPIHLVVISKTYERDLFNRDEMSRHCASVTILPAAPATPEQRRELPERVWRHLCPDAEPTIAALLAAEPVDLVHVQGSYLMPHVPAQVGAPIIVVDENVDHLLESQRMDRDGPSAAAERRVEFALRLEREAWLRASMCTAVTEDDVAHIREQVPGHDVRWSPSGCDHIAQEYTDGRSWPPATGGRIAFVGNYGYGPTADAAGWLVDELWPAIRRTAPRAELVLAGANPTASLLSAAEDDRSIVVTGPLPSLVPVLRGTDLFVCPLRIGGGIKTKILEALYLGLPIVTTAIGVQGLPPAAMEAVVVADSAEAIVAAASALLRSPERRAQLARRSVAAARFLHTWERSAETLFSYWTEVAARRSAAALAMGGER